MDQDHGDRLFGFGPLVLGKFLGFMYFQIFSPSFLLGLGHVRLGSLPIYALENAMD